MLCKSSWLVLGSGVPAVFVLTAGLIGQLTNVSYVLLDPWLETSNLTPQLHPAPCTGGLSKA